MRLDVARSMRMALPHQMPMRPPVTRAFPSLSRIPQGALDPHLYLASALPIAALFTILLFLLAMKRCARMNGGVRSMETGDQAATCLCCAGSAAPTRSRWETNEHQLLPSLVTWSAQPLLALESQPPARFAAPSCASFILPSSAGLLAGHPRLGWLCGAQTFPMPDTFELCW